MSTIHSLSDAVLLHIIQLSYREDSNPAWKQLNWKFHNLVYKFQKHYELYHHLEKMLFSKWKVEHLTLYAPSQNELELWKERREYHRIRTQQESQVIRFENLFGGHEAFLDLPTIIPTCDNLLFDTIPKDELTNPIMRGFDGVGHQFVSIQIKTGRKKEDPIVHYLFVLGRYWSLHYWSGDRNLLGRTAGYLNCLVKPYGFNPATYDYCRKLFISILKNQQRFMNCYS